MNDLPRNKASAKRCGGDLRNDIELGEHLSGRPGGAERIRDIKPSCWLIFPSCAPGWTRTNNRSVANDFPHWGQGPTV
jgi:hypothetical protein